MYKINISDKLLVKPSETIREVIRKLTITDYRFQLVVKNKKLLGTIVDGDVRRAILLNKSLDDKVTSCMNKFPVIGNVNQTNKYEELINSIGSNIKFLPVLNKYNNLSYIILDKKQNPSITYLIMAGGFGKRLGAKTKNIPKPLLKINNKPILEHILKKIEKTDYQEIYLSTFYLHKKIENYINLRKNKKKIKILIEDKPLGTAGSINFIKKNNFDCLVVINADLITDIDFKALTTYHFENNNDITITVSKHTYNLPYGLVSFDEKLSFKGLQEKPDISNFILSGIYCLNKSSCSNIKKQKIDMPDIIKKSYKMKKKVGIFPIFEYWRDIGNPDDFEKENKKK